MRGIGRTGLLAFALGLFLALAPSATADPGETHGKLDNIPVPPPSLPNAGPGSANMSLLDVADKDGSINSDIAFYGDYAYAGNYDGFRIFDISRPAQMDLLSDTRCRSNQGDVSVFKAKDNRLIMLQSIDRPVTTDNCSAVDTPLVNEDQLGHQVSRARFGFEGLRMFDVTNPRNPKLLKFFRTECGSHTHTLVPDPKRNQVHAYVASYPLGSHITPMVDRPQSDALGLTCDAPHSKISIVTFPLSDPEAGTVRTKALSDDTEFYDNDGPYDPATGVGHEPAFQSCHDHQAFLKRNIMVASCAGDAQYWDISRRGNPTSGNGEQHTHIKREVPFGEPGPMQEPATESFDFIHNATVNWSGDTVGFVDESGGGVEARCDGANTRRGFTFFYPLVEPGTPVDGFAHLLGRYMVPRAQNTEICVSHNGNVLPTTNGRDWQVQAFYQAGNSFVDFTDPAHAQEMGFSDLETSVGAADSWSSYWYNDVMYVNGGLDRRGTPGNTNNRGFEAYALFDADGDRIKTRDWKYLNPQTQEAWQHPGAGHKKDKKKKKKKDKKK
jgi:LVIVD repeat